MDNRPHVGLIIDHPTRDLPTVAMLGIALAHRGCAVSIIPLYDQSVDVPLLALDAIVTTFARPANRELIERYHAQGIAVFVLDSEGGVLAAEGPNQPATLAATIRDEGWAQLLAGYFFWGQVLHDAFVTEGAMPRDLLHLTGCPRFDVASARWRSMLKHPRQDFVLVNTAFPVVNSRFTASGIDRPAMLNAGWDAGYVEQMIADSRIVMSRMIALIKKLADEFPRTAFVVRPHPFENYTPYEDALSGTPNVTVDGAGSVLNVIANSRCVVQLNCSTAVEAVMLDKLPLSPDFISTPHLRAHSPLPNQASRQCSSEEELIAILADLEAEEGRFDFQGRYRTLIEPYFYLADGRAADRMADRLETVAVRGAAPRIGESIRASRKRLTITQLALGSLANLVGSRASGRIRARFQPKRWAKHVDLAALARMLEDAGEASGQAGPIATHHRHPLTGLPLASIRVALPST